MKYVLMHKDIEVALLNINIEKNYKMTIIEILNGSHMPIGGQLNAVKFHEWWTDRAIPRTRQRNRESLKVVKCSSNIELMVTNYGVGLSDCYWIKPIDSELVWNDISLYRNEFKDIYGEVNFFDNLRINSRVDYRYPVTTQGNLQKKWLKENDRQELIKGNDKETCCQSLNEVFATLLHRKQGYKNCVEYWPVQLVGSIKEDNKYVNTEILGCACYNFCNEYTELVTAWELLQSNKFKGKDYFGTFKQRCEDVGIAADVFDRFTDYEIITDFIMSNTDRHLNNIGLLRNPNTLQFYGFAPIFDTGNAMLYDKEEVDLGKLLCLQTTSFCKWEVDLLKHVKNRFAINLSKLPTEEEFKRIYYMNGKGLKIDLIDSLYKVYKRKIYWLEKFQSGENIWEYRRGKYE